MSETTDMFVTDLRALADFYEAHPTLPIPIISPVNAFVWTQEALASAARDLGGASKEGSGSWFSLRKWITPSLALDINVERAKVCTARVVGSKVIPAQAERVENIIEWECGSVLDAVAPAADLGLVAVPAEVAT